MHKINLDSWARKDIFLHFKQHPCSYSVTSNYDITTLLPKLKSQDKKFYASLISILTLAANKIPEFRMSLDEDGDLVCFNSVQPEYTIPHPESYSYVWSEFAPDFESIYANVVSDMEKYKDCVSLQPQTDSPKNLLSISCMPTMVFTSLNLNIAHESLLPVLTMGKFFVENQRTFLPIAIQVNHMVCDGMHVARFAEQLQKDIDNF